MIQVLERADRVLGLLAGGPALELKTLTARTGLKKPTLYVILNSLVQLGYAAKSADGRYSLGQKLYRLAFGTRRCRLLQLAAEETARRLADQVRESVVVALAYRGDRYTIAKAEYRQSVMVDLEAALRYRSFYETVTGRVLLACLDGPQRKQALKKHGLPGTQWAQVSSREELDRRLAEIRAHGVAEGFSEDRQTWRAAVPVFGPDQTVWAALGISLPASRAARGRRRRLLQSLRQSAERMGNDLSLGMDVDLAFE